VIPRFHLALLLSTLALAGCGGLFDPGPLSYVESPRLKTELQGRDVLQDKTRNALAKLFGPDPRELHVPPGMGLPLGGARLASYRHFEDGTVKPQAIAHVDDSSRTTVTEVMRGGFAVYREHCLHCHGVSGAGDGPTAPFLYPRPRDYRKGIFKFTSTNTGAKPTRDDLEKTVRYGLHGTSMPAFDASLTDSEIRQVIDYVIFLSMRGETELALIDEAMTADEKDPQALSDETALEVAGNTFNKWKNAASQVMNPPVPRPPSTRESILRGRTLFLGGTARNKAGQPVKGDCIDCHGPRALGDGTSFVAQHVFNTVVFGGDPSTRDERLKEFDEKTRTKWKESLDDWGEPLRPANLNRGVYKGGRRPIDLYWRIAKGINGAKMPAHYPANDPEMIWDLVNFVLALPYEPKLLEDATLPPVPGAPAPSVAASH
jgi:mono/diheme cytochrome c family protein